MRLDKIKLSEYRELTPGESIEKGDVIVCKTKMGSVTIHQIDSTTKTMAKSHAGSYTERFPRFYSKFGFQPIPYDTWNNSQYVAYRKST